MDSKDLISRIEGELGSTGGRESATPLRPPPRVADHELIRRIGAGSYGEVWLARSVTGQWRAVKAVSRDRFSSDRPYEREFRGVVQFEPISRSHPSLVQVLHVGRDDEAGAFYYVMELADGAGKVISESVNSESVQSAATAPLNTDSLITDYSPRTLRTDLKARGRLAVAEAVTLGVELAGALGHIHRHGLVHRDVKPSNVIFVQGRPKLADLGLVTSTSEARSFVGTEGFIPPEGPGTVKADLFALGRLLYEAVTGKDRCEFPELPSDLDSWSNREEFLEFNEVVTQLCAPEPERRYSNAAEVAGDLNLILAGRSVRRANGIERRLAQARRISVMTLIGVVVLVGIIGFQQFLKRELETRASQERALRERAESAERAGQQQLYTALLEQARATVRGGELGQRVKAIEAVRRAAAITNAAELRREALSALALPDLRWQRDLPFGSEFTGKEPDPAFERIAVCRGSGPVEIRALSNLAVLATLPAGTNRPCYGILWSPDGRFLALKRDYTSDGSRAALEVWDLRETSLRRVLLIHEARHNASSFHPQRAEIIVAVQSGTIIHYDLEHGTELTRLAVEVRPELLKFSPDGKSVAVTYGRTDGWGVSVHDFGRVETRAEHVFAAGMGTIEWHPQGRWLAVTDFSGAVHLMDPNTGGVKLLGRHRAEAVHAAFDGRGDYLVTGGWERALICWDLRAMQRAFGVEVEGYIPRFKADGSALAVVKDSGVQLYTFERPEVVREVALDRVGRVRHGAFSPDGRWLAASTDAGLNVNDLAIDQTASSEAPGGRLFWSQDSAELLVSSSGSGNGSGGTTRRWRLHPAEGAERAPRLEALPLPRPAGFNSFSIMSNRVTWTAAAGSRLAALGDDEPFDAGWAPTIRGINGQSPDGRWLGIYAPSSPYLHVYELPEFKPVAVITNLPRISGFSFSPAGDELVVVSRGHAEIHGTTDWKHRRGMTNVVSIAYAGGMFQPEARTLWLAANLQHAGLYDARTFDLLLPLPAGHFPLAVSADGHRLAASVDARRVMVWDLVRVRARLRELGLDWNDSRR
jgi:hypothetical protein